MKFICVNNHEFSYYYQESVDNLPLCCVLTIFNHEYVNKIPNESYLSKKRDYYHLPPISCTCGRSINEYVVMKRNNKIQDCDVINSNLNLCCKTTIISDCIVKTNSYKNDLTPILCPMCYRDFHISSCSKMI